MAGLLSQRRRRRAVSCHFCGAPRAEDCDCGGHSRRDQDGNLIDYLPEMSNVHLNPPLQARARPGTSHFVPRDRQIFSPGQTMDTETFFCRTCAANQALQMNLLANYLPSDSEQDNPSISGSVSETQKLLDRLPQYKQSLETRYPMMCEKCSPKVSAIIQERDYRSKAAVLHSSARRFAPISSPKLPAPNTPAPLSLSPFSNAQLERPVLKGMGSKLWRLQSGIWRLRGGMWFLSHLLGFLVNLFCTFDESSQAFVLDCMRLQKFDPHRIQSARFSYFLARYWVHFVTFFCLEPFWVFFDFTWFQVRKNRAQGIRTKTIGKRTYLCMNAAAYTLRVCSFVLLRGQVSEKSWSLVPSLDAWWRPKIFGVITVTLVFLFLSSVNSLRVESPIKLRTPRQSIITHSSLRPPPPPARPFSDEDLFSTLSLSNSARVPALPKGQREVMHSRLEGESERHCLPTSETPIFGKSTTFSSPFVGSYNLEARRTPLPGEEMSTMDWEPTPDATQYQRPSHRDAIVLPPQTFLPPLGRRGEIGIERLFENSVKLDDSSKRRRSEGLWRWVPSFFSRSSDR